MSAHFTSRRKRSRGSPASTMDHYETGPPKTSGHGHQTGSKQKNGGRFKDVSFNLRSFSEAPDSLANPEFNEKLRTIQERSKLLTSGKYPKDTKRKKEKQQEEPLDIAMREQSGASNRRKHNTFGYSQDEIKSQQVEDDEIQQNTKPKSTELVWNDLLDKPIPKKNGLKCFGLKEAAQQKDTNAKRTSNVRKADSYYSIGSSPIDKCNAIRKNSQPDAIDLCAEGETDSEENNADQSKYRHANDSRTFRKAAEIDQPIEKASRRAKKEETKITQTLAAIENDEIFVPQKPFNLYKAPSSSEGRKITATVAPSDKVDGTERKIPLDRGSGPPKLKNPFKQKKSATAGHPIFPGASLQSNKFQTRSNRSLESNDKRSGNGASLESSKSLTTPHKTLLYVQSSDEDCDSPSKWSSTNKPAAKKMNKNFDEDYSFDDFSSANSVAKKRKNNSNREPATSSPIRRTRSSARKNSMKRKHNEIVDMLDDSDDEEVRHLCC